MTPTHHIVPADQQARALCAELCEHVAGKTKIPFVEFPVDDITKSVLRFWHEFPEKTEKNEMALGLLLRMLVAAFVDTKIGDAHLK